MLGLTVPVAQLRASTVVTTRCCCPDPAVCHCPSRPASPTSTLQPCGKTSQVVVASTLVAFIAPPARVAVVSTAAPAPALPLAAPHAPPDPERPAAPS